LPTTIQPTVNPGKIVLRTASRGLHLPVTSGRIAAMLLLLLIGGCKERQLATPTAQMDTDPQLWVRVLLLDDVMSCTLRTPAPFSASDGHIDLQSQVTKVRFDQTDDPTAVVLTDGRITIGGQVFTNEEVTVAPDEPYIFNLNGADYRGNLKLIANPDGSSFDAINLVPPEPYLAGVVGAEMPSYWEKEALKAQAIAARTYCFYIKKRFGAARPWDLKQTAAHQVYRGLSAESAQVWNAVNQTKGQVLACRQSDGSEDIFPAYYSSTCGGHTENSEGVFGDSFPSLASIPCPYCQDVAKPKFFFWPMIQFDKTYIESRLTQRYPSLKELGRITEIDIVEQSDYGQFSRLTKLKLVGSTGKSDFLRAEDFRLAVDPSGRKFKSTICEIVDMKTKWAFLSGRGWGHGVGMCQCGAEGMARTGATARQILSFYYPGSKIMSMY